MTAISEYSFIPRPSTVDGVGLFATHDIETGTVLYTEIDDMFLRKIEDIPPEFQKYCIVVDETNCMGPESFRVLDIWYFINHADRPNVKKKSKLYIACREIKRGDELFIDYNDFGEPKSAKESYYKRN